MLWAPSPIENLKFYEVQIGSGLDFLAPIVIRTKDRHISHHCGFDTTCFVRVRAITSDGEVGDWSRTLDMRTGLTRSVDLTIAAATNPITAVISRVCRLIGRLVIVAGVTGEP